LKPAKIENLKYRILWNWDCRTHWSVPGGAEIINSKDAFLENFKRLVDFMSEHELNGLILWGFLRETHGGVDAAIELCEYANDRDVRIIPGVGVNSYGGFWYTGNHEFSLDHWLAGHPELRAVGKDGKPFYWSWNKEIDPSMHTNACPSKIQMQQWHLRGVEWLFKTLPIGGVCFETGDIGTLCFCPDCRKKVSGREGEQGAVSFTDMRRTLPPLMEAAKRVAPAAWIIYATYKLWDSPLARLMPDLRQAMPEFAIAQWNYPHDPKNTLRDNLEEIEAFRNRIMPPFAHNIIYAAYGGHFPAHGMDGKPHYQLIARLCKRAAEMGIEGLTLYGEVSDSFDGSQKKRHNEINYLSLQEFSNNPLLSVEEFETKYRNKL